MVRMKISPILPTISRQISLRLAVKKVFVNMATDKQLSDVLGISLDDAKAIVAYRDKVKGFKSLEDMKAVPNVDAKKIDAKKDQLVFGAGVTKP